MKPSERDALTRPYEASIAERGLSPEAIWMDQKGGLEKGLRRCEAVFGIIDDARPFSLLDVGCGPGYGIHYLEQRFGAAMTGYLGIDVSEPMVAAARRFWPGRQFECRDLTEAPLASQSFDYAVLNGVLTARFGLAHAAMEKLAEELLAATWNSVRVGMSFNVMSPFVDWTREDLFHWPFERAAGFCKEALSRHVNFVADYGLYEYTVQVYRQPQRMGGIIPDAWRQGGNGREW